MPAVTKPEVATQCSPNKPLILPILLRFRMLLNTKYMYNIYIYTYKYINTPDDRCIYSHTRIYIHERKHLSPVLQVVFLSKNHYTSSPINAPGLACSQRSPPCAAKCNRQKPGWDRSPGLDMGLAWEKSDSYSGIWCWNMMLAKHI